MVVPQNIRAAVCLISLERINRQFPGPALQILWSFGSRLGNRSLCFNRPPGPVILIPGELRPSFENPSSCSRTSLHRLDMGMPGF